MEGKNTFWKLLSEHEIEIPIIQRDYAQGRESARSIRLNFLKDIKHALVNGNATENGLELDFVYGSIGDRNQFIPVDGQQRLTTMFLLHLYLIHATEKNPEDYNELQNFKYKTRMTSEYFCKEITSHRIVSERERFRDIPDLRKAIINQPWFGTYWRNDPTVDGMLNMLKDIHELLKGEPDLDGLLEKLIDEEKCPICFYYLDLVEYHLDDNIYIKMNARGKALTDYENFKAELEKFLAEKNVQDWEKYAHQLDTDWTAVFWNYVPEEEKNGDIVRFDERMMNFIVAFICNEFACYTTGEKGNDTKGTKRQKLRDQIDWLFNLSGTEFTNSFASFSGKYFANHQIEDSFVDMFRAFSLMTNQMNKNIKEYSPSNGFFEEKNIFEDVLVEVNKLTYEKRARFYAYTRYLLNHEGLITPDGVKEWLRVVEHLIAGQYFNDAAEYVHVIRGFHWLAENSTDIVGFLANYDLTLEQDDSDETADGRPFFNKYIFKEECVKAKLMKKTPEKDKWDAAIRNAEANPYLNGQIHVLLEFAGIDGKEKDIAEWSQAESQSYLEKFEKYARIMDVLFVKKDGQEPGLDKDFGNNLRRALLTKGDFTMRVNSNMSFLVDASNARGEGTWKRLFRPQKDKDQAIKKRRQYFKDLLDDPVFNVKYVNVSCEKIIEKYLDKAKKKQCTDLEYENFLKNRYFIEVKGVMDFVIGYSKNDKSEQCWNYFRDDYNTRFLLFTTRLSGNNFDYYKYALYRKLGGEDDSRLSYEKKAGVDGTIEEPIVITVSDDEQYTINLDREAKTYTLKDGKENTVLEKASFDEMVDYIKNMLASGDFSHIGSGDFNQI